MNFDLKSMTLTQLERKFKDDGFPNYRASQVFEWLHKHTVESFEQMTNLPLKLREELKAKYPLYNCKIVKQQTSALDDTIKFLFSLWDKATVETVLMKYKHGYTLCISTQVGCSRSCAFCATGISGLSRNLLPSEMLSQVYVAQKAKGIKVSNIVLMGMGEPLDNFSNVIKFIDILNSERAQNIGKRNITLSTCGIVPKILELADVQPQVNLSVSLHAPNDELRGKIMPVNALYSLKDLLDACIKHANLTGRRTTFEYALFDNLNDKPEHARELAFLLKGLNCHVNLIPANPVGVKGYKTSKRESVNNFYDELLLEGINVTIRRTLGQDIEASCGQLKRRYMYEI